MREKISLGDDIPPRNLWMRRAKRLTQPSRRFSDNFNAPLHTHAEVFIGKILLQRYGIQFRGHGTRSAKPIPQTCPVSWLKRHRPPDVSAKSPVCETDSVALVFQQCPRRVRTLPSTLPASLPNPTNSKARQARRSEAHPRRCRDENRHAAPSRRGKIL